MFQKIIYTSLFLIVVGCVPMVADAQVVFTEIMYDVDGTDSGYEWIEVYNGSTDQIDLASFFLFENNVYHKISSEDTTMLSGQSYAVIADNPVKFLEKYPNFSGTIVDSAFSLNNSGETIKFFNADKIEIDSFSYTSDMGANGTGNSLQEYDGVFIVAEPTPGIKNSTIPIDETEKVEDDNSNSSSGSTDTSKSSGSSAHADQVELSSLKQSDSIDIGIGRERLATVRSEIEFRLITGEDNGNKILWSFGDGFGARGRKTTHTYKYPGEYVVVANVSSGKRHGVTRTKVIVSEVVLDIKDNDQAVSIENKGEQEINVGGFTIRSGDKSHTFFEDTIILKGSSITLTKDDMDDRPVDNSFDKTILYYPDGTKYAEMSFNSLYTSTNLDDEPLVI